MEIFPCVVSQLPTRSVGRGEVPLTHFLPILPNIHLSKSSTFITTLLVQVKLCVPCPPVSLPVPAGCRDVCHKATDAGELISPHHIALGQCMCSLYLFKLPFCVTSGAAHLPAAERLQLEPTGEKSFLKRHLPSSASIQAFLTWIFLLHEPETHLPPIGTGTSLPPYKSYLINQSCPLLGGRQGIPRKTPTAITRCHQHWGPGFPLQRDLTWCMPQLPYSQQGTTTALPLPAASQLETNHSLPCFTPQVHGIFLSVSSQSCQQGRVTETLPSLAAAWLCGGRH